MAEVAKNVENQLFFNVFQFLVVVLLGGVVDRFLLDLLSTWGSKSIKNQFKKRSEIRCNLECNLEGSWIDF